MLMHKRLIEKKRSLGYNIITMIILLYKNLIEHATKEAKERASNEYYTVTLISIIYM